MESPHSGTEPMMVIPRHRWYRKEPEKSREESEVSVSIFTKKSPPSSPLGDKFTNPDN
jgi:hypothetical protein